MTQEERNIVHNRIELAADKLIQVAESIKTQREEIRQQQIAGKDPYGGVVWSLIGKLDKVIYSLQDEAHVWLESIERGRRA